jgi:hypothetical protein
VGCLKNAGACLLGVLGHVFKKETLTPAIIALVVSGGVTPLMNGWVNQRNTAILQHEEAKRQAVARFALDADAFGSFATVFVLSVSRDDKVDPQAFERLASNIVAQKAALDALIWRIPPDLRKEATAYENALLALNSALDRVKGVESMKEFWERTSDLLVVRQDLLPRLEADAV